MQRALDYIPLLVSVTQKSVAMRAKITSNENLVGDPENRQSNKSDRIHRARKPLGYIIDRTESYFVLHKERPRPCIESSI
nr:hypothetical protein [Marinicaulis flavus]